MILDDIAKKLNEAADILDKVNKNLIKANVEMMRASETLQKIEEASK
jgi:hypothetical protein